MKSISINSVPSWQTGWKVIAKSKWWQFSLITVGSLSSLFYPHVPLIGFAVVAGNSLTFKKALISVISIWLANQLYGFTVRQYPLTFESLTWGIGMAFATVLVTVFVALRPKFTTSFWGYLLWLSAGVIGGSFLYEGSIFLVAQLMGGHGLTTAIFRGIFVKNLLWAVGLSALHCCAMWLALQAAPQYFPLSFPFQSGYRPPGCGKKF